MFWGVSVKSLRTGQRLFAHNEDKFFVPASNMKLFTTAVALVKLGPDFRYTTSLYTDGSREKGVLKGDVYLRGSGDPTISERFQGKSTARVRRVGRPVETAGHYGDHGRSDR